LRWISLGYVVAGDAANSEIYGRLRGSNGNGEQNMPPVGQLSAEDLSSMESWINYIEDTSGCDSGDGGDSDGGDGSTATERTSAALAVLATYCNSCHTSARTGISSAYLGVTVPTFGNTSQFASDSDFVIAGLVSIGDPSSSWIFRALKTHGDINSMPKNAAAISDTAKTTLENWIEGIGEN
jgi:hypothetical protein